MTAPVSPEGPSPLAALADVLRAPRAQRELWGWSVLAIGSLAIAGVFAVLLAVSRLPGIEGVFPWPLDFFKKGLVIHVVFSFVVWFLAVFCALLHLATQEVSGGGPRFGGLGRVAGMGMAASFVLLFAPAFRDRGEPSLNNYVPAIMDPLYYAGLVVLGVAVALVVVRLLANLPRRARPLSPFAFAMVGAGLIYLMALVATGLALAELGAAAPSPEFNEDLFWGGGHLLQFVNATLLAAAWFLLAGLALGRSAATATALRLATVMLVVAAGGGLSFHVLFDGLDAGWHGAFTNLQYALAPPTVLVALAVIRDAGAWRRSGRPWPWRDLAFLCVVLSPLVFGAGGFLGLFVDGGDTRTPAHYHGVIAGINVAFMGLFFAVFLPLMNPDMGAGRTARGQVMLFAGGQLVASLGLFLAGGYGAPRKVAGDAQTLEALGAKIGMVMNGIGALVAVAGGVLFIWTVGRTLLRLSYARRRDSRPPSHPGT